MKRSIGTEAHRVVVLTSPRTRYPAHWLSRKRITAGVNGNAGFYSPPLPSQTNPPTSLSISTNPRR